MQCAVRAGTTRSSRRTPPRPRATNCAGSPGTTPCSTRPISNAATTTSETKSSARPPISTSPPPTSSHPTGRFSRLVAAGNRLHPIKRDLTHTQPKAAKLPRSIQHSRTSPMGTARQAARVFQAIRPTRKLHQFSRPIRSHRPRLTNHPAPTTRNRPCHRVEAAVALVAELAVAATDVRDQSQPPLR